jgi:antitoxin VapB
MNKAKVFMNGRSQAIRLPKEFRVKGAEVTIRRVPEGLLLMEADPWEVCREACAGLSAGFVEAMAKREQPRDRKRATLTE